MKQKLTTGQQQEQSAETRSEKTTAKEFASVEELLRHDAAQTAVPPEIAQRLRQSLEESPPPRRSWWRKLFS
ncbi:MAG: hypothetical protein ABSG59_04150 [Verrucomicrobiota bacterium]|jgi:hypothetical protein